MAIKNAALFLDMDDTLIRTRSKGTFATDVTDWEFIPGVLEKILEYQKFYKFLFIVSNQGGIEQGYHTYAEITGKFLGIVETMRKAGVRVDDVHFSPYSSTHYFRKPSPGFAYRMAIKYQLDLQKCLMVGDGSDETCWTTADRDFARNAGMQYIDINEFLKKMTNKIYKLRHKPTGLFYQPTQNYWNKTNLSENGKIYKKPNIHNILHICVNKEQFEKFDIVFSSIVSGHSYNNTFKVVYTKLEDWECVEYTLTPVKHFEFDYKEFKEYVQYILENPKVTIEKFKIENLVTYTKIPAEILNVFLFNMCDTDILKEVLNNEFEDFDITNTALFNDCYEDILLTALQTQYANSNNGL